MFRWSANMVALRVEQLIWWCSFVALTGVVYGYSYVPSPSYGNLIKEVLSTGQSISGDVKSIYLLGGCVNISGTRSLSYFDIRLYPPNRHSYVRTVKTVLLYLPRDAAVDDVKVTSTSGQKDLKPFSEITVTGNGEHRVYLSQRNRITTSNIRVSAARTKQVLSICFMRVYDVTMPEYCDCRDECNRNADVICNGICEDVDESKCNMVNVALNKPANMSSSHLGANASYVVNGITGTSFSTKGYNTSSTLWNCIHTVSSDHSPNWTVDLKQPYTFKYVTIYLRSTARDTMEGVRINVDGELCRVITEWDVRNEKMDLTCDTAMTGRYVTLTKDSATLQFCELQVWECKPGFYETRCEEDCSGHCEQGAACNVINGTCPGECEPGWYNAHCRSKCSPGCTAAGCDKSSGECLACRDHFAGDTCNACDNDHFGDDCSKQCGHCLKKDRPCDRRTGNCERVYQQGRCDAGYQGLTCTEGCLPVRYGIDCGQRCSGGCQDNECNSVTGNCSCLPGWKGSNSKCTEPCDEGSYGDNCTGTCGEGCGRQSCDKQTGVCPCELGFQPPLCQSVCKPGSYGQNCSNHCGKGCEGGHCNNEDGRCTCGPGFKPDDTHCRTPCDKGSYGNNCTGTCGKGCRGQDCDKQTGVCSCEPGFQPPLCQSACRLDRYGSDCNQTCSRGCENNGCERINGHCSCRPGWKGSNPKCTERCEPGTYGRNCSQRCGQGCANRHCDQETGVCSCVPGYQSPLCRSESDENNLDDDGSDDEGSVDKTVVMAASVVFLVIYISSNTFIIIWFIRRRRGSDPSPASNVQGQPDVYVEVPQGVVNEDGYIEILPTAPISCGNRAEYYMNMASENQEQTNYEVVL